MDIEHIAKLSKIAFTKEEYEKAAEEMADIIKLMGKVTECAEESAYLPSAAAFSDLREDRAKSYEKSITDNAKEVKGAQFVVPKVV